MRREAMSAAAMTTTTTRSASSLKLFHCRSARSLRVLWTLKELGLRDYELITMTFPPRVHHREFLKINPLGTIPFIRDGETQLTESCAAPLYICQKWGAHVEAAGPLLVTPDEDDYGSFLNWLFHADATLTFPQTLTIRYSQQEPEKGLQVNCKLHYNEWNLVFCFGFRRGLLTVQLWSIGSRRGLCQVVHSPFASVG